MLKFFTDLASALDALRRHAILFLLGTTIVALALLGRSWLDAHDASMRLQATLAAQQKTITDADQRQSTRDAQLTQTLAQIASAKQKVQTPAQAAAALTQAIPQLVAGDPGGQTLPSPITIELPPATSASKSNAAKSARSAKSSAQKTGTANSSTQNEKAPSSAGDVVAQFGAALASATNSAGATQNSANGSASGISPTVTNSKTTSANTHASDNTVAPPNNSGESASKGSSANSNSSVKSIAVTKYPWTSLKLELARLGIGPTTQAAAKNDLENREGSSASQKGSATAKKAPGSATAQSTVSASENAQTKSASNAQTNSLSPTSVNEQGTTSSAQTNSIAQSGANAQDGASPTQTNAAPLAIIRVPQVDLKPLYDAVEDCEVCQAKLTAAQGDLSDEKTKFAAVTAQRDAAISAARGTFWTRARTAAKWLIIGAAAGAVLARYH
jgi:hypothetical protein